jgi:signal transduction histidine kinase
LLEINLSRAWWILVVSTVCTVLFTISGQVTGTSEEFAPVQAVDYALSFAFFLILWQARKGRLPGGLRSALPLAYAIFFVLINDGYYFSAWPVAGDNVGYAFGVLTPAALLYLRPALFVPFLLVNHIVVCAVILRQPAAFESTVSAIYGATISVFIAVISSIINYRTKVAELEKTALVARRNQELAASNLSLLEMSRRMDEMMALTAHDLRGPLFGIASLCELEKENPAWKGEEHAEFLDMVGQSATRMGSLVNKMVDDYAARNDSLSGILLTPCDLAAIFSHAIQHAQPLAQGKNIQLMPSNFPGEAIAEGNAEALDRVFGNLLSNAIKYSPPGAQVELAILNRNGQWICEVRDEGPGISATESATLFRKLQTGSNTPTSGEHSSGLGLYSTRKLIESMNGSIAFEPRLDGGSIFRISLKAASASA